jgi:hypothetical protein
MDYLANNLTTKIKKLNLGGQIYLEDKHVNSLVIRCNKIVALNLGLTSITENCLSGISENLNLTLEELDISEYINPITCAEIYWHLRSMSKLKVLNLPNLINVEEIESLEKKLPNLSISQKELQMTALQVSVAENSNPRNGIWEIKIKPLELLKPR